MEQAQLREKRLWHEAILRNAKKVPATANIDMVALAHSEAAIALLDHIDTLGAWECVLWCPLRPDSQPRIPMDIDDVLMHIQVPATELPEVNE